MSKEVFVGGIALGLMSAVLVVFSLIFLTAYLTDMSITLTFNDYGEAHIEFVLLLVTWCVWLLFTKSNLIRLKRLEKGVTQ